jgi:site-specific DNA-methyltransferase (adenine-specific)
LRVAENQQDRRFHRPHRKDHCGRSGLREHLTSSLVGSPAARKPDGKTTEKAIVEVKGGENVSPQWVRALGQVVERERAKIGVLVTLADPTVTMRREAAAAGFYKTEYGSYPKLQILTVEDLFNGQKPHMPWIDPSVFKKARREKTDTQGELGV